MVEEIQEPPPKLETAADILFEKYRPKAPEVNSDEKMEGLNESGDTVVNKGPDTEFESESSSIRELLVQEDEQLEQSNGQSGEEFNHAKHTLNLSRYNSSAAAQDYALYDYKSALVYPDSMSTHHEAQASEDTLSAEHTGLNSSSQDDGTDMFVGKIIDFGPAYDPFTNRFRQVRRSLNPNEAFKHYKLIDDLVIRMPLSY